MLKSNKKMNLLDRIEINPDILKGKPVIKGTRLSVQFLLGLLAQGATYNEILEEYDGLTQEDIQACMQFASSIIELNEFYNLKQSA